MTQTSDISKASGRPSPSQPTDWMRSAEQILERLESPASAEALFSAVLFAETTAFQDNLPT